MTGLATIAPQGQPAPKVIAPQPGPQYDFASTPVDVGVIGGAAGGGKTYGLLMEGARWINIPGYFASYFRRTHAQIRKPGGVYDKSPEVFTSLGGDLVNMEWRFKPRSKIYFSHIQYEKNLLDYDSAEIPLMLFDQLEQFTAKMFFYMLARNRSTCGVTPYIRGSCNPMPDIWLRRFIDWYIDKDSGIAIPKRSGKVRFFAHHGENEFSWADTKDEITNKYPRARPLSFTFIRADVHDNPALLDVDPGYIDRLHNLTPVERERKLYGNWNAKEEAGKVFNRAWYEKNILDPSDIPAGDECMDVIFTDLASTEKEVNKPEPDKTAITHMRLHVPTGKIFVIYHEEFQEGPSDTEERFKRVSKERAKIAVQSGVHNVRIHWELEPGSAGKREAARLVKEFIGFASGAISSGGKDKMTRAQPFIMYSQAGNVYLQRGEWNEPWMNHLHNQPQRFDDTMDSAAYAYTVLVPSGGGWTG